LEDPVPDHSTLSKNRHGRFRDSDTLRFVFEQVLDNYGTAAILGWMVNEKQIEPQVPVRDKTQRDDETSSGSAIQWDEQANEYRCPQGHVLRSQ
jgi:hypothetical protein